MDLNKSSGPVQLVSVVLCTYNGARYVAEQLESILQQTYTNLEVIIADDASTDDTYAILKRHAAKDGRICLYQRPQNAGYNTNFSEACSKATGAFIAIADQDDVWEFEKVEKLVKKIGEDESIILVHGISARFEVKHQPHMRSLRLINYFRGNDIRLFYLANYISGHSILFRKILLKKALPFPLHVDYDWWLAAHACVLGRIEFVNEILVWHRMHQTNATKGARPKRVQAILPTLLGIKGMPKQHYEFGNTLLQKYEGSPQQQFSWPAFLFLIQHAPVLFGNKKRSFPYISYIKHAWHYAKRLPPA